MIQSITLSTAQHAQIVEYARAGQPDEICGIIGGYLTIAQVVIPLPNIAVDSRSRYQVDPAAFVSAYRQIERSGAEVIGLYHSHPRGKPIPSAVDIVEATWPEAAYVIVGFPNDSTENEAQPVVAAWSIRHGIVAPITLILTK